MVISFYFIFQMATLFLVLFLLLLCCKSSFYIRLVIATNMLIVTRMKR